MGAIVVTGGGVVGLCTAMLLAGDGHDITVLERDAMAPPDDPDGAWGAWDRRGVNQFHMVHMFLARFRQELAAELPDVVQEVELAGALGLNPLDGIPEGMKGATRPDDDRFLALTGRRPVVEAALGRVAARTARVRIERGTAVAELLTGPSDAPGVPHITGVRTEDGRELRADLVVDATGRRSPLPRLLAAAGARPPLEEADDSGFVYYGRYFRSADGSLPPAIGGLMQHYGSVSTLTLPADNGTWGVAIVTAAHDAPMRALKSVDRWEAALRAHPLVAHWADGEPLRPGVDVMAKIEDRIRRFVVDGAPVATGVAPVGDAWACTNPTVGRGASIGMLHAVALRDLLREQSLDDPTAFALAWDQRTLEAVGPWYHSTVRMDRHRLLEVGADIRGERYEPEDEAWEALNHALAAGITHDQEVLRAFLRVVSVHDALEDVLGEDGMADRIRSAGGGWRDEQVPGPSRAELLAVLGR